MGIFPSDLENMASENTVKALTTAKKIIFYFIFGEVTILWNSACKLIM
jgi:hypothetical protein